MGPCGIPQTLLSSKELLNFRQLRTVPKMAKLVRTSGAVWSSPNAFCVKARHPPFAAQRLARGCPGQGRWRTTAAAAAPGAAGVGRIYIFGGAFRKELVSSVSVFSFVLVFWFGALLPVLWPEI